MKCCIPSVCKVGVVKRFKFLIIRRCRIILIFSDQGGDKFHILLKGVVPLEIDSFVAYFEDCGTVYLEQDINFCTLTGGTPSKFSLALLILMFILPMYFLLSC